MRSTIICMLFAVILFFSVNGVTSGADETSETVKNSSPFNMTFSVESDNGSGSTSSVLKIALFLTLMSILPGLLMSMTSFLRIIIVISFLKQAMGTPQMPPNQIVVGIAIFLTMYVMSPVWTEINSNAIQPYVNKEISEKVAFERGLEPLRSFMLHQTREDDIALFLGVSKSPRPTNINEISTAILIPAFITSELKTAFQMGFILYLPFIVIDAVISTTLTAMGMFMLPPVMISLPFKLVLFVLADGWRLVIQAVVSSFRY